MLIHNRNFNQREQRNNSKDYRVRGEGVSLSVTGKTLKFMQKNFINCCEIINSVRISVE